MRAPNELTASRRTLSETADGNLSISTLLVLIGIGTVVPVLLFSAFVIYSFGAAEQGHYELRVSVAAHEAQAAVDRELKGKLGALQTFAASPPFTPERPPQIYEQAKQLAEYLGSSVVIFDAASRKQMFNTRISFGTRLPDRPDPNVGKVVGSGKPVISDLLIDQFGRHFSFVIYVPVIRDESVTAVIASSFDSMLMAQVLQEDVQSADWVASIIDRNGVILARSKDYWAFVGKSSPSGIFERRAGGEVTIARTRDFEGKLALVGLSHSSVADWMIATSAPLEIIEAPLRRSWIIFGIAGLSFLTLSVIFAFVLGRHLTRSVSAIVRAAAGLGRGELVLSISSALREINVIFRALSRASIERKSAEEHIGLLMREQAHRNKNLLAVVQSIARLTARYSTDFNAFQSAFSARIGALACSTDLLVNRQWVGTDPASLVRSQLAPFTELDGFRVKTDGPSVMLKPEATEALGLALHELATNAVKYGALSVPHGSVSIKWQHGSERFSMSWSEHDGPPVTPPLSKGFGRVVIEQMAAQSLSARVSLEFLREGVHWTIDMPVSVTQKGDGSV